MDNYSTDFINQITLNCLISKSQLMKINNTKIKKNLNVERSKKIKKYNSQLIELFKKLLNKTEPSDLFDDVKSSYIQFIDKTIIYLDNIDTNVIEEKEQEQKEQEQKEQEQKEQEQKEQKDDDLLNEKINYMMNRCYNDMYNEIIMKEENQEQDQEIYDNEDDKDDEDDENDEY
jgi:hypothetical protein